MPTTSTPRKLRGSAADDRRQKNDEVGEADILLALAKSDGQPMSRRGLRQTGISPDRLDRLLARLEKDGRIVATETTVRGNAGSVYRLAPEQTDEKETPTDKRLFS